MTNQKHPAYVLASDVRHLLGEWSFTADKVGVMLRRIPALEAEVESLRRLVASQRELMDVLEDILGCPTEIDPVTISSLGLEGTMQVHPYQVVANMSVALIRIRNARKVLAKIKEPKS